MSIRQMSCQLARALENVDLKGRCHLPHRLLLLLHGMIWNQLNMQDEQFLVPMANLILCFQLNFAIFCGHIRQKIGYIRSKYVHLNAVITLSNNKQDKYSNSTYKIYLKPCHDYCFSLTYFQNNMKTHNDRTWPVVFLL